VNVDAHQHFWNPAREPMPWIGPEHAAIDRAFGPDDLRPLLAACGIGATVLVQAACSAADTDSMFEHARRHGWIGAVTAWVALDSPGLASARLDELAGEPKLRGIRHLIHGESDAHWILRPRVLESLALLEARALLLELPCVFPRHLGDVPELARRFPQLTIVIDHLGKPPIGTSDMAHWEALIRAAAAAPNVAAKVSGLNTALADPAWDAADLRPSVEVALDCFGPTRLMLGSDWPMALLNGGYERVWAETVRAVESVAGRDAGPILGGTAVRLYGIEMTEGEDAAWQR
jgi:L-fuconolactonase